VVHSYRSKYIFCSFWGRQLNLFVNSDVTRMDVIVWAKQFLKPEEPKF